MPKNLELELVRSAAAKKLIEIGAYDHYLGGILCDATGGELYVKADMSNFPTVEVLRSCPEKYVEFLKGIIEDYKFQPLDAEVEVYTISDEENSLGSFASTYISCENKLALNFEYDGRLGSFYNFYLDNIYFTEESSEKAQEIAKRVNKFFKEYRDDVLDNDEEMHIKLLYNSEGRVNWRYLNIPPRDKFNIEDNYSKEFNNFVPNKMDEFIKEDSGGIVIFRGAPGTGKSSYCKHLIMKYNNEADFLIVSQDTILSNPEGFRTFLISGGADYVGQDKPKKQIFIIEDCEKLLVERDSLSGNNTSIILSDILNYSDGIVGDLVQSKFIFTFNTSLSKVDKALLRKGRMKLNYEFKKLMGEDLDNLLNKLGKEVSEETKKSGMSLADIYNLEEENYIKDERKIGFGL